MSARTAPCGPRRLGTAVAALGDQVGPAKALVSLQRLGLPSRLAVDRGKCCNPAAEIPLPRERSARTPRQQPKLAGAPVGSEPGNCLHDLVVESSASGPGNAHFRRYSQVDQSSLAATLLPLHPSRKASSGSSGRLVFIRLLTRQGAGVDRGRIIETAQEGRRSDDFNRRVPLLWREMRIRTSRRLCTAPPAMCLLRPPMFRQR